MVALFARSSLLSLALAATGFAASAAPFGGTPVSRVGTEVAAPAGMRMSLPMVLADEAGARVHGTVCRVSTLPQPGISSVKLERLDGSGRVTGMVMARVSRTLTGREGGCGVYDGQTDWRLSANDRVRVRAD